MKAVDVAVALGLDISCKNDINIKAISSLNRPRENTLMFCNELYISKLNNVVGCVVIIPDSVAVSLLPINNIYIFSASPRLSFLRAIKLLYTTLPEPTIMLGSNVKIEPSVIIGASGFGFERNEQGKLEKFPQTGGVVIGNDVEIQAFSNVDRGTIDNTIIGSGTKIDTYCHIGHNVEIGEHCEIRAKAMLAGRVKIGDYVTIAPAASIIDGVTIGNNAFVGLASVVTKDVPANTVVAGNPARKFRNNDTVYGE